MEKNDLNQQQTYLLVYVVRPEPGLSSLVWISRQQRRFMVPNLINILNYYHRLTNGLSVVDQNWDFLMNWVHLNKQRAFVPQVLLSFFVLKALLCQGNSYPHTKDASPEIQQDNLIRHCSTRFKLKFLMKNTRGIVEYL